MNKKSVKNLLVMMGWILGSTVLMMSTASAAKELAKVNGKLITQEDFKSVVGNLTASQKTTLMGDIRMRKQILDRLIDQEMLVQEAEKSKLDQSAEYKDALMAFRKQFLATQLIEKSLTAKMSTAALKKYYESNKLSYNTDRIHVQHILLDSEAKANEILAKARAKDADFMKLAEDNSKDPSAKNNRGDLGPVNRDSPFVPEFKDAAFNASKGDIIGPVKTAFGYHIIKIVEKAPGKTLGYDEVEMRVQNDLRQKLIVDYLSALRKSAKIAVDEKALEKI